jgi:hypothetical protein
MEEFVASCRRSLDAENWLGGLTSALVLVEVCASAERPGKGPGVSGSRYRWWWETYISEGTRRFISAEAAWAFRCSLLHTGHERLDDDRLAVDVAREFRFFAPHQGSNHLVQWNDYLVIDVEQFCSEVLDGVAAWRSVVAGDAAIQGRLGSLLNVRDVDAGPIEIAPGFFVGP